MKNWQKKKIWVVRGLIFIFLFVLAEITLRMVGYKPKVLINWAYMPENVVQDSVLYADELGITHYIKGKYYKPDGVINDQGFIGAFNYDSSTITRIRKEQGKKIVMALGDSFLDGCCSDSVSNSFAGILSRSKEYSFLNFGIPGTDPLQYRLIVEKYAPQIKPDLILVNFYTGNDIMTYERTPKPYIPCCYITKDSKWLNSEPPPYHLAPPNYVLNNFDEAVGFYKSWYTLTGKDRKGLVKFMGNSIIFSKLYLGIEFKYKQYKMRDRLGICPKQPQFSYNNLKFIEQYCKKNSIPFLIIAIPTPGDVIKKTDIKSKYAYCFNDLEWLYPDNLLPIDYDGKQIGNHFTSAGHKKYAELLNKLINNKLSVN